MSPSGKATVFGIVIRRFESYHPSQLPFFHISCDNLKSPNLHLSKAFNSSPTHNIGEESYTGREITAFLNEYEKLWLDRAFNIHVDEHIINKFLSHGFINADVPTLDNYHGEYAVLDVKSLVEPIDHHTDHA